LFTAKIAETAEDSQIKNKKSLDFIFGL